MAFVYDGQTYPDESFKPDLGNLVCIGVNGTQRSYFGFLEDESKLPTYDNLASGSDATLVDKAGASATKVLYYHAPTKAWYAL